MRDIKFRAWDEKRKQMLPIVSMRWNDEIPDTEMVLMESAGLHDKNGKEIWEGDIVHVTNLGRGWIEYRPPEFRHFDGRLSRSLSKKPNWGVMEIIGNIYENPELIVRS